MRINVKDIVLLIFGLQSVALLGASETQANKLRGSNNSFDPEENNNSSIDIQSTNSTQYLYDTPFADQNLPVYAKASRQGATTFSAAAINAMTGYLNYARALAPASNMLLVSYNQTVANRLDAFVNKNGPAWFFANYTGNIRNRFDSGPYKGMHLMSLPEFKDLAADGWTMGWHDTGQDSQTGKGSVPYNFWLRFISQPKNGCFKYSDCNSEQFTNYIDCNPHRVLHGGETCSWSEQYYPRGVYAPMYQYACKRLGIPGPNAPGGQPNSYFCYMRVLEGLPAPQNDLPYQLGKDASNCPDGSSPSLVSVKKRDTLMCKINA